MRELHPAGRQTLHVRGANIGCTVSLRVHHAVVIGYENDNVGFLRVC